eukprot:scaffold16570_cov64-Phaeocystis_antarctica.AAC.2
MAVGSSPPPDLTLGRSQGRQQAVRRASVHGTRRALPLCRADFEPDRHMHNTCGVYALTKLVVTTLVTTPIFERAGESRFGLGLCLSVSHAYICTNATRGLLWMLYLQRTC